MMSSDTLYQEHRVLRAIGGGMTVEEMRARMTVDEFADHVAFEKRQAAERHAQGSTN